jgi:hypothetical protein
VAKVIRYRLGGYLGNRMFEVLLAHSLARQIPGTLVTGDPLPDWHIAPPRLDLPQRHVKVGGHRIDVARLRYLLGSGLVDGIETDALGCRMELLDRDLAQALFPAVLSPGSSFGADALVISIRAAEILGPRHKDYRPLPIAFYARLLEETGLRPVFHGQIGEDAYSAALRARFPRAEFLPSRGPMADFGMLRAARHICVSISTFAWLAAWLSEAETVHLPVAGMFHPLQRPDVDLLPLADPRYRFHLLPVHAWGGTEAELAEAIAGPESGRTIGGGEALRLGNPNLVLP